jgi:Fur family ferric uptake transcriptional regulator
LLETHNENSAATTTAARKMQNLDKINCVIGRIEILPETISKGPDGLTNSNMGAVGYRTTTVAPHSFRPVPRNAKIVPPMTTAEPMSEEQEVFLKHIQKKGLKRTSQRDLILDVFLRTEQHLSNEDLYRLVQKEDPGVGQTTVYRTLKLLTEAGLAREVRFGDGRTHYEHNYKHQHHDHMICSECGKIIEFFSAELEAIQDAMAAKHRFQITQHLLRIIGICVDCRRAMKQNAQSQAS